MSEPWHLTGSTGAPWRVTRSRTGDGYVIHLHLGDVMVILPAPEAHKLGSALQAASGVDTSAQPDTTEIMGGSRTEGEES